MTDPREMTDRQLCDEMQEIDQLLRRSPERRAAQPRYEAIYAEFDRRRMASLRETGR